MGAHRSWLVARGPTHRSRGPPASCACRFAPGCALRRPLNSNVRHLMKHISRSWLLVPPLILFPAVVAAWNAHAAPLRALLSIYLFLSFPHWLAVFWLLVTRSSIRSLLLTLAFFDISLIAFSYWATSTTGDQSGGDPWLAYLPFSCLTLFTCGIVSIISAFVGRLVPRRGA